MAWIADRIADRVRHEPPAWKQGLRHLRRARHNLVSDPVHEAQISLELLEEGHRQWEQTPPADEVGALMGRAHHQACLMEAELLAGHSDRASKLADGVINLEKEISARRLRHDPSFEVHSANIILGHVAVQTGDFEEAQRHLLGAAQVSGRDPVLRTYGPDLELAQELLARGFEDTVIEYLGSWRKRWRVGRELLDWWITQISEGRPARVNKWRYLKTRRLRHFLPTVQEILGRGK